jgi:hypothetical protein
MGSQGFLGRNQEVVSVHARFFDQFALGIDQQAVEVGALDDVQILSRCD